MKKMVMMIGLIFATALISTKTNAQTVVQNGHCYVQLHTIAATSSQFLVTWDSIFPGFSNLSFSFSYYDSTLSQAETAQPINYVPNLIADTAGSQYVSLTGLDPGHRYSIVFNIWVDYPNGFNPNFSIIESGPLGFTTSCLASSAGVTASTTICNGTGITLTATGGNTYTWSPTTGLSNATIANPFASPTTTTTYTVTASTGNCSATAVTTVTVSTGAVVTATASSYTICNGSSTTLNATGGNTYTWSPTTGLSNATIANPVASPSNTTTYTVTAIGGCAGTASVTIVVSTTPLTPSVSALPNAVCSGNTTQLNASGGTTYSWAPATGLNATNISNPVATIIANITYTVTVGNGTCSGTASTVVNVNPVPTITATGSTICAGQTTTVSASGGATYVWSTSQIGNSIPVTPAMTTTYTVTGSNGNCSNTATATVTVIAMPVVNVSPSQSICPGSSVTLYASGGTSYNWPDGSHYDSLHVSPVIATTYTVVAVNGACESTPATVTVTISLVPVVTISNPTNTICTGQSATLTANGATSYTWSTGSHNSSISVTTAGTYTVTGTNSCGGSATAVTTVTVNGVPNVSVTANGPTTFCVGGAVTLTSSAASGNAWSTGTTALGTTQSITVDSSEVVSLVVTSGGCGNTAPAVTVTVNQPPSIPIITAGGPTTFCATSGANVILSAPGGMYTYVWSNGDITPATIISTTGNYRVTITDVNGCSATSVFTSVVAEPLPSATNTALGNTTICQGNAVTLESSPGASYLWNTNATTQSISATLSGSYSVTVTGTNGCSKTSSAIVVTVNPLPVVSVTLNGNSSFCEGTSVQLISSSPNNNVWSDGTTGQVMNATMTGTYTVTVTNPVTGCSNTALSPLLIQLPAPTVIPHNVGSGVLVANASGGTAPYVYDWNPGGISQSMTYLATTSYTVTATDANGCQGSFSSICSVTTGISQYTKGKELQIFPNPSSTDFTIVLENQSNDITLIDMLGKIIQEYHSVKEGSFTLFGSDIPNGMYFIQVKNSDGISNQKVVKQ